MQAKFVRSIKEISDIQWKQLETHNSPFISQEFLSALENHGCIGEKLGWIPCHLIVYDGDKTLAFMPLFQKYNSYGELVFDWSWADAYRRIGLPYYPKLVSAIPYTPVTGERIIFAANVTQKALIYSFLIETLKNEIETQGFSSFHCLFPTEEEMRIWSSQGFIRRVGCQFHWNNENYQSFEHYLEHFASRKRKNIRKERQQIKEQGITFKMLKGSEIESDLWPIIHALYEITFLKKGGMATFTQAFFTAAGKALGDQFLVNLAMHKGRIVACAILYRDDKKLYGRHWGCFDEFSNLHFETCYYQGLDYAIQEKLQVFEPGAQGEHKVSRGFLPVKTWSAHWIKDTDFRRAISDFALKEEEYMQEYIQEMQQLSPFKC